MRCCVRSPSAATSRLDGATPTFTPEVSLELISLPNSCVWTVGGSLSSCTQLLISPVRGSEGEIHASVAAPAAAAAVGAWLSLLSDSHVLIFATVRKKYHHVGMKMFSKLSSILIKWFPDKHPGTSGSLPPSSQKPAPTMHFYAHTTAQLTSVGLSERRHHHRGPLLGFTVTAEVEGDGVVRRGGETHLVAAGRLDLVLHRAEVKLCNELWVKRKTNRKTQFYKNTQRISRIMSELPGV